MADISSTPPTAVRSRLPWREMALVGGIIAAVVAGGFTYVFMIEPMLHRRAAPKGGAFFGPPPALSTPFFMPGIPTPPTAEAADAPLDDTAEVIGVSAGGKHRAYVVRAFEPMACHVVNDLLGDVPVTVTYCNRCDCAHVFTCDQPGVALDVVLGAWVDGRMVLRWKDVFFMQQSGQPMGIEEADAVLPTYPHERTTWKAWRTAHPDTDVYLGVVVARDLD
jgi:Protein of unknown function (DUF3179)